MATSFTFEQVADNIPASPDVSLALDRTGNPRIVFSHRDSGQIFVARRDSGAWTVENVPSGFMAADSRPRLAIDSQGNPQIAYRDRDSGHLIHGVKGGSQWSFTHVPTQLATGDPSGVGTIDFLLHPGRLDTESRDVGYFVYVDLATNGVGFAHTGSIGPTPVSVQDEPESDQLAFAGPSAMFDPSENFFVGYVRIFKTGAPQDAVSVRSTHVVDIEESTFANATVIEGSQSINVRRPTSIVRTFSDGCLAYFDMANMVLKAGISSGGFSSIETIASNVRNIATPSAAAKGNQFRVAYADSDALKLASRSGSGTWTTEAVEAVSGGTPSLAYDNAGTANVAYSAGARLRYARRSE
jgi:hypothetical protein